MRIVGYIVAAFVAFFAGALAGSNARPAQATEPCTLVEPPPIDAQMWLYRCLDSCEAKCGKTVPFDAECEPSRVRCNCGRPPSLGKKSIER